MKKMFQKMMDASVQQNYKNILSFVDPDDKAVLLDLGCDDGEWTLKVADKLGTKDITGIDLIDDRLDIARSKGLKTIKYDLNKSLPVESNSISVVHANQVIEHVFDVDLFISEIYRILKPNGYAVISTENLSSWHNIFALVLGFQPFSLANVSSKGTIGNPLSIWNNVRTEDKDQVKNQTWLHNKLFSIYGLKDLFEKYRFKVNGIKTAGYYPFPGIFSSMDPNHGHWLTIRVTKLPD